MIEGAWAAERGIDAEPIASPSHMVQILRYTHGDREEKDLWSAAALEEVGAVWASGPACPGSDSPGCAGAPECARESMTA